MPKTLEITEWNFSDSSLSEFDVEYRITDDELSAVTGPKSKRYSDWDTAKTLQETEREVKSDLESDEGI